MSNQQQQQPVSVEDALRLFNEVQQLTVRDAQDNERFDAASGGGTSAAAAANSAVKRPGNARSNNAAGSRTSFSGPVTNESELRRQVELSEAVMKKLHAKNKALTQEVDELKRRVMSGGGGGQAVGNNTPRNSGTSSEVEAALRRRVAEQDATIELLNKKVSSSSNNNGSAGKPPLASGRLGSGRSSSSADGCDGDDEATAAQIQCKLLEQRVSQLQVQVDQLVETRLECIREGESTGRVNKEVKAFFVTSRQKMIDDAAFHEAERSLLNQRLAKLETEVMAMRLKNMP